MATPQKNANGLGLGLYIVAQIAEAHGGMVDVASTDSETRFTFSMPLVPAPQVQIPSPATPN